MELRKPPLGVIPLYLWSEQHPEPTLADLLRRYRDVDAAVLRYRVAGLPPRFFWLWELGIIEV